jgi:hypothetical protein
MVEEENMNKIEVRNPPSFFTDITEEANAD